jgi:hypothetical protein
MVQDQSMSVRGLYEDYPLEGWQGSTLFHQNIFTCTPIAPLRRTGRGACFACVELFAWTEEGCREIKPMGRENW